MVVDVIGVVGTTPLLLRCLEAARAEAPGTSPVLLAGEPGSGRTTIARAIHLLGPGAESPFYEIPGAGIEPRTIRPLPPSGSLLVREIGAAPHPAQEALLALATGESPGPRLLATSSADLAETTGFLPALADRLLLHTIRVPPLRDRRADIPALARHAAERGARDTGRPFEGFSRALLDALAAYSWPGNVTELFAVVARLVAISERPVLDADPSFVDPGTATRISVTDLSLEAAEKRHITLVLERCGGRIQGADGAASLLGIPASTLRSRMAKLGIPRGRS